VADELRHVEIANIIEPHAALRLVDENSVEFLELRDSIAEHGWLSAIPVRQSPTVEGKYEIIGGWNRFRAAKSAGLKTIPCIVKHDVDDLVYLVLQLQENSTQKPTSPVQYAKRLKQLLDLDPDMAEADLARLVKMNVRRIREYLGLLDLFPAIQTALDGGEISFGTAVVLSQLFNHQLQQQHYEAARTMTHEAFRQHIRLVMKALREAMCERSLLRTAGDFKPMAYLRPVKAIKSELDSFQAGPECLATLEAPTAEAIWKEALKWVLHLDAGSIDVQREHAQRFQSTSLIERIKNLQPQETK